MIKSEIKSVVAFKVDMQQMAKQGRGNWIFTSRFGELIFSFPKTPLFLEFLGWIWTKKKHKIPEYFRRKNAVKSSFLKNHAHYKAPGAKTENYLKLI